MPEPRDEMGDAWDADTCKRQAQKMESVGRLAAGAAHDFNNVLTAILGSVDAFLQNVDRADAAGFAADIRSIAERGVELTRPLVRLARQQEVTTTAFDLNQVVQTMTKMLRRLVGGELRIEIDLEPGTLGVVADRSQVEQAILNLVVNARDAMPDGGTIHVRSRALAETEREAHGDLAPGAWALVSIADGGSGIDPTTLPHVFDAFFTTKPDGQGTGLGLTMVRAAVDHAGGRVDVTTVPGVGTTFTMYLPLAQRRNI